MLSQENEGDCETVEARATERDSDESREDTVGRRNCYGTVARTDSLLL